MSEIKVKIDIPQRHQDFCKEVAKLARQHGLKTFYGTFEPGFQDPDNWQDKIQFSWEDGRHGEDSDRIHMTSTKTVITRLGPDKPKFS